MVGGPLQVLELASSITKTGRHDIAEILLEVASHTIKSISLQDGPFNFQGGGVMFFFLKKYSDSECC
jgi:hypothetical protein